MALSSISIKYFAEWAVFFLSRFLWASGSLKCWFFFSRFFPVFLASKQVHRSETVGPSGFYIYIKRPRRDKIFRQHMDGAAWSTRFSFLLVSLLIFVHVTFGAHGDASQPEKRALNLQSRKEENLQRKRIKNKTELFGLWRSRCSLFCVSLAAGTCRTSRFIVRVITQNLFGFVIKEEEL